MNTALFWHRRDLRIDDNAALYKALTSGHQVQPVFIFDQTILAHLPKNDQRVLFIHQTLVSLIEEYKKYDVNLIVKFGDPKVEIPKLVQEFDVKAVFTNRDYEPSAKERDAFLFEELKKMNCEFFGAKDQVIFEKSEVTKDDGKPYAVFTPYMRKWKEKLTYFYLKSYPVLNYTAAFATIHHNYQVPTLKEMGFESKQTVDFPSNNFDKNKVEK